MYLDQNSNQNFSVRSGGGAVGLHMEEADGTFGFQLYGDSGSYGFLDAEWANWDIQKQVNGTFKVDEGSGLKRVLNEANWTTYITVGDGGLTTKNFTAALKTKLDGIATGATNTAIPHYTSAIAVGDGGLTTKDFTVALKNKLDGIAAGATNTSAITNNNQLTNGAGYITASNAAVTNKLPLVTGVTAMHNTQGTQNSANAVLRTQVNGYSMLGWINTTSGATSSTLTRIYCSEDGYIRYQTPATFGTSISPHINFTTIANNKILPTSGNYTWTASTLASAYSPVGIATSFVRSANGWPEYGTVLHVGGRGGSDAGGDFQLFSGHGAANGGNYLRVRNADNSASPSDAWTAFRTIWDS